MAFPAGSTSIPGKAGEISSYHGHVQARARGLRRGPLGHAPAGRERKDNVHAPRQGSPSPRSSIEDKAAGDGPRRAGSRKSIERGTQTWWLEPRGEPRDRAHPQERGRRFNETRWEIRGARRTPKIRDSAAKIRAGGRKPVTRGGSPRGLPPEAPSDPGGRDYRTWLLVTRIRYAWP